MDFVVPARSALPAMIKIEGLVKSYGARRAVDGLDLQARPGEITALLGPNGAGKSTTIHCVVGLESPDSGSVQVAGHDVASAAMAARRAMAYVPEIASLYDPLTPEEYLTLKARLWGIADFVSQERITRLLAGFELTERRHDPIASFSKGMTQKIALCSALIVAPAVLVLDEPLSGLDVATALVVKETLKEFARRGGTVLYSTHILDVAETLAHRIAVLHEGKLVACGTLAELRKQSGGERRLEEIFRLLTELGDPAVRAREILGPAQDHGATGR